MLLEGVLVDVQTQLAIQLLKEATTHAVALLDNDGILLAQLLQVGEGRTKHRVRRYKAHTGLLIEVLQIGLYAGDIADNALLRQVRYHLFKHRDGIFQRYRIDEQFGLKGLNLVVGGETLTVVCKSHAFGISLKHSHFVVETQQVDEERSHLSCAHY